MQAARRIASFVPTATSRRFIRAMASDARELRWLPPDSPPAESKDLMVLKRDVSLGCIQMQIEAEKEANLRRATKAIASVARFGAKIIVLPECFNSPYGCNNFPKYAEKLLPSPPPRRESPTFHMLQNAASRNNVYLIGGSIPERDPDNPDRYYNTCLTFGPDGTLIDTFRKIHLFDIDIPGKISFRESEVLSPGNKMSLVELPEYGTIAIAICYDIRFPELATIAARNGAFALIYPGSFNLTTGALHWEVLARSRALDNQLYVAVCSPARDMSANYNSWGHSMIVDPMARIIAQADAKETAISYRLHNKAIADARRHIPLNSQRRFDIYPDVSKGVIGVAKPLS
ncbi:hypothetical protein XA68_10275 [Ophiocordyceps unilateralis]|uniref:CN hydrolase domain-containing protein n=1 Tax=Ophiocordyceps unilateralis TaxID=268505 RepID=A0A2A9PHW5_OPHUN|nr:hypothetical protein XA68_10275 [Ophiocordyceps unilateralis]